ncbi:hypothetical protein INP83_17470 [Mucilaginibacter sp. 21P]|uniref:glycoside hydrolase family 55 protein n=1 Tax=Mucilaginibacter sp. 21P TaxID=2778902 RepID=UPI001C580C21|nr:glycoside hydrolase family 55 protein [Mucilaginibacter sp. 21P]QXV64854.1 hypothetical protein INP83_17470 [Mucilaginibacter sp. 21P]
MLGFSAKALTTLFVLTGFVQQVKAVNVNNPKTAAQYVSPEDYGAAGDGIKDDTRAIQSMFSSAILKKLKVVIPAKTYKITRTISIVPPAGSNEFRLDVEANGDNIFLYGGSTGACLRIVGLRFSTWKGVKIKLLNAPNIVGIDLDTDGTAHSTSNINFTTCHVSLGKGIGQRGWRMGAVSGGGADISIINWNNCSVYGNYGKVINGQIGWHNEGPNSLNNVLNTCFGAYLDKFFSNTSTDTKNTGNGAFYFYGTGTSHNNLEFEISNAQTYLINGGRFELGKHMLVVHNGNVAPAIIFRSIEISNYNPAETSDLMNGCLFFLDMPCSLKIDGCNIGNQTPYTEKMIRAFGGGEGKAIGTIIIDGGSIAALKNKFYQVNLNKTKWSVYLRGVGRLVKGVRSDMMDDKAGMVQK